MKAHDETTDFGGLAGELSGRPDGRPPLILLHGLTFDHTMWLPALAELRNTDPDRHALALDLPGHGGSPAWPRYDLDNVAAAVHAAVTAARLPEPVIVGHSMAAVIATVYAARYPARGVVNVDQWLLVEEYAAADLAAAWRLFEDSMHADVLPEEARKLLRPVSSVRQDVVAGYWREAMDRPADEFAADLAAAIAKVRANGTGYLFIAGHEVEPGYQDWFGQQLPQAAVEVWPGSGHFPHLAYPARFAGCLASTARWGDAA